MTASVLLKIIGPPGLCSLFFFYSVFKTKLTALWCRKSVQCEYTESDRLTENAPTEKRGPKSWSVGVRNPCLNRTLGLFAFLCVNVE